MTVSENLATQVNIAFVNRIYSEYQDWYDFILICMFDRSAESYISENFCITAY